MTDATDSFKTTASSAKRWAGPFALAIWLALTAWFYGWTATSAGNPLDWNSGQSDIYNRLIDGFLGGELGLLDRPDPRLAELEDPWDPAQRAGINAFHDVTYFEGRYYLYFGPTPLVLMLPWRILTGNYLGQNVALVGFAWWGALMGVLILWQTWRRHLSLAPGSVFAAAVILVTWGNFVPVLLRRPLYYELAIASAMAMALTAVFALQRALDDGSNGGGARKRGWFILAGLAYGLAIAGRPHYLFGGAAFVLLVWPQIRQFRADGVWRIFDWWKECWAWVVPLGGVIVLLLGYNFARFGNPFEFGTSYMMSGMHPIRDAQTGLRFAPTNLYYYFFAQPHWIAWFPFVAVTGIPFFELPANYTGVENVYGVLVTLPAIWFLVIWWVAKHFKTTPGEWGFVVKLVTVIGLGPLAYLLTIGGAASRYMVDFVPMWLVGAAIVALGWSQRWRNGFASWVVKSTWWAAVIYSTALSFLISLQHNGLWAYFRPAQYAAAAKFAERLVEPVVDALGGVRAGSRTIRLRLPQNRTGKLEPLVVTGHSYQADFLWVYYQDDKQIVLGFEHTSYGGPKTKPIKVDYGAEQLLEVEMGSFYPPASYPFWQDIPVEVREKLKKTLVVRLNGKIIWNQTQDFYEASPGDVSAGHNHVSQMFGRDFSGEIIEVTIQKPIETTDAL